MTLTATGPPGSLDRGFSPAPNQAAVVLDFAALAVIGALVVLIAAGGPAPVKELLLLAFISYVPGRAVTTHWPSLKGPLLAVITVAGSLSLTTLLATAILWLHWWRPSTLFAVEAMACAGSFLVALGRRSGWRIRPTRVAPGSAAAARPVDHLAANWRPLGPDLLLPVGLSLWGWGVSAVQLDRIDQWGLLPALPAAFYVGLALAVVSIIWLLGRPQLSGPRLVVHLVALVIMIAGTPALIYPAPRYPWLYKHVGVVQYINLHGALNQTIDIYQNFPGFFALVAWFDRVTGVTSPLQFAAWTETVVMLASCLAIYAAARQLHLTERECWVGLFIFVVASWVDEVYFSPQALGYALSLFVLALVVSWFQDDRSYRWMGAIGRLRPSLLRRRVPPEDPGIGSDPDPSPGPVQSRVLSPVLRGSPPVAGVVAVLGVYGVLVFVHELSPYVVALQVTVLAVLGRLRPRWLAPILWLIALGYLAPRFGYVNRTYGLLNSMGSFFSNLQTKATGVHRPYDLGVRFAAYAAWAITLLVWGVAALGVFRRVRAGRPTVVLSVLAFSPIITFFLTNYGGEATYRVYFFSVPWVALLVASAIAPDAPGRRLRSLLPLGVVLVVLAALLLPAYLGDDEMYVIPPGEITAAEYFYTHAPPGSALILAAPNFPSRVGGRYNLYLNLPNDVDPSLLDYQPLAGYQELGPQSLPAVAHYLQTFNPKGKTEVYVAFAESEFATTEGDNLALPDALQDLEVAMTHSPEWSIYFKNSTTTILLLHPPPP